MNSAQRVDARLTAEDAALLAQQHSAIDAFFDQHIPTDRPVAVLQFPWDANVGNHMMWLAISEHLHRRGVQIAYAAHQYNFRLNDLMRAVGDGPILFLGGVTVSRLWPSHSQVKRSVAAACPGNRLISLPSTMIFVDEDDRRERETRHTTMIDELKQEMQASRTSQNGIRQEITGVFQEVSGIHATLVRHEGRLDRIERRLELSDAPNLT